MGKSQIFYSERQRKFYFRLLLWTAGWIYWLVGNLYFRFMPCTTINQEAFDQVDRHPQKGILVPLHSYIVYGLWVCRRRGGAIMASQSNIGSLAAAIITRLGGIPVRGGRRFGGIAALVKIIDHVNSGRWAVIAADGPRGPRYVCGMGPIVAAQRTGRPIIPVSFAAKRKWQLNTWDRTIIPKPFSPVVWMYGDPLFISKDLDRNGRRAKREGLERILIENERKAQEYFNSASERKQHEGQTGIFN